MSFSVHVNNMESFPLLALKGILETTGELMCDITLHDGKCSKARVVTADDNPRIERAARLMVRSEEDPANKLDCFEWDDIKLITVN